MARDQRAGPPASSVNAMTGGGADVVADVDGARVIECDDASLRSAISGTLCSASSSTCSMIFAIVRTTCAVRSDRRSRRRA